METDKTKKKNETWLDKAKKHEEETSLEYKKRREKEELQKNKIKADYQKRLLNPNIKNNLIIWVDKYKNGNVYEGWIDKTNLKEAKKSELFFEIKRGLLCFWLKIKNEKIKSKKTLFGSIELLKLQKTASAIVNDNSELLNN